MSEKYKDLLAWQRAMDLVKDTYRTTKGFPKEEVYSLTTQMRRAAVAIPSNIAEGKGRYSTADVNHFLVQARGSLYELETQVLIATDLKYLSEADSKKLLDTSDEVAKLLNGLIRSLREKSSAAGA